MPLRQESHNSISFVTFSLPLISIFSCRHVLCNLVISILCVILLPDSECTAMLSPLHDEYVIFTSFLSFKMPSLRLRA
jgi:hypothetical protein